MIFGACMAGVLAPFTFSTGIESLRGGEDGAGSGEVDQYIHQHDAFLLTGVLIIGLSISTAIYAGPLPCMIVMQFPKPVRFSGVAIGWGVSNMIFSSISTPIITIIEWYGGIRWVGVYVSFVAFIAAAGISFLSDREPISTMSLAVGGGHQGAYCSGGETSRSVLSMN